jgi:hypothetical protein
VRLRYKTEVLPMFLISFRARVPVTSGASAYFISVSCGDTTDVGPILADVRRGQIITKEVAQNGCRGVAHVQVLYEREGGGSGPPFNLNGAGLTVGTRTVLVH